MGVTDRKGEQDPKKRAKEIIDKLDMTGDRKLSKEEFVEGYDFMFGLFEFFFMNLISF